MRAVVNFISIIISNSAIMENSQIPAGDQRVVTVGMFAAKYRSKNEIHSFLTVDGGVYLPA